MRISARDEISTVSKFKRVRNDIPAGDDFHINWSMIIKLQIRTASSSVDKM